MHAGKSNQSKAAKQKGKQAQGETEKGKTRPDTRLDRPGRVRAVRRPERMQTATVALEERLWGEPLYKTGRDPEASVPRGMDWKLKLWTRASTNHLQLRGILAANLSATLSRQLSPPISRHYHPYHISVFHHHKPPPQNSITIPRAFVARNSTISVSLPPLTAVFFFLFTLHCTCIILTPFI